MNDQFGDMPSTEIHGRFLPSRVYNRWKWTVRFGLMLIPVMIFLAEGMVLFLTPGKYRSTTLFSLENGPEPVEIVQLATSRSILQRVVETLQMGNQLNLDHETAITIAIESITTKIVPDTAMIEISATLTHKNLARDLVSEIPIRLREHLVDGLRKKNAEKVDQIDKLISDASDVAAEKAAAVTNHEKIHGTSPEDATAMSGLQRARRASLLADAEIERLRILRAESLVENIEALPRLNVHSAPVISQSHHSPKVAEELAKLTIRSLVIGLLAALLLPYLMELAFPPHKASTARPTPDPVGNL